MRIGARTPATKLGGILLRILIWRMGQPEVLSDGLRALQRNADPDERFLYVFNHSKLVLLLALLRKHMYPQLYRGRHGRRLLVVTSDKLDALVVAEFVKGLGGNCATLVRYASALGRPAVLLSIVRRYMGEGYDIALALEERSRSNGRAEWSPMRGPAYLASVPGSRYGYRVVPIQAHARGVRPIGRSGIELPRPLRQSFQVMVGKPLPRLAEHERASTDRLDEITREIGAALTSLEEALIQRDAVHGSS
jgi:hypothetical protein